MSYSSGVSAILAVAAAPSRRSADLTPAGAVTLAVFEIDPVAEEATVPVAVKVALLPVGRLAVDALVLQPRSDLQRRPMLEQVKDTPVNVAGKETLTEVPTTSEGSRS